MAVESSLLAEPTADDADSLVSSNDPDDMANEQTWPTEEEMNGHSNGSAFGGDIPDAKIGTTPKAVRRVPKGTSEYQAAWIVDESEDEEEDGDGVHEDGEAGMEEEEEEMEDLVEQDDDDTEMETDGRRTVAFEDLDAEEEEEQYVHHIPLSNSRSLADNESSRLQTWRDRKREEEDDLQFPDEIDTPMDVPTRTRFQRYRGLRSFRTSPWDPYENLPRDYARIFQFEDFKRTERAVKRRAEEDNAAVAVRIEHLHFSKRLAHGGCLW